MTSSWLYPIATNLALFLTIIHDSSSLFQKTHLVPIGLWKTSLGTKSYTSFLLNWFNSSCIAKNQCSSCNASSMFLGSIWKTKVMLLHKILSRANGYSLKYLTYDVIQGNISLSSPFFWEVFRRCGNDFLALFKILNLGFIFKCSVLILKTWIFIFQSIFLSRLYPNQINIKNAISRKWS